MLNSGVADSVVREIPVTWQGAALEGIENDQTTSKVM
jgi:hypothetical protein